MNEFVFNFMSSGKSLIVILKAETMNKALIIFAENYNEIQHLYSVFEIPNNLRKPINKNNNT